MSIAASARVLVFSATRQLYQLEVEAARKSQHYYHNLALALPESLSLNLAINHHVNSPNGPACCPTNCAFALLACLMANLAAIPCMITLFRNAPKASPHDISSVSPLPCGRGSHPAASAYQDIHSSREGRPGVLALGKKAGLVWVSIGGGVEIVDNHSEGVDNLAKL